MVLLYYQHNNLTWGDPAAYVYIINTYLIVIFCSLNCSNKLLGSRVFILRRENSHHKVTVAVKVHVVLVYSICEMDIITDSCWSRAVGLKIYSVISNVPTHPTSDGLLYILTRHQLNIAIFIVVHLNMWWSNKWRDKWGSSGWSERSYVLVRWARVSPILMCSMLRFAFTVHT